MDQFQVTNANPTLRLSDSRLQIAADWRCRGERGLVDQAILADEQRSMEIDLSLTWRELVQGLRMVVGTFFTDRRCGVLLVPTMHSADSPLVGRRLEILEGILNGEGQKRIAIELGVAPSTVSMNARLALEGLGATDRATCVHPILMLAATASRQHWLTAGSLSFVRQEQRDVQVIGIGRPDLRLADVLPAAEYDVVRSRIEGLSYADIAKLRGTSERTIANQIAAVFKRMRVSGRSELLSRLFALDGGLAPAQRLAV
jgi:DNA-binding NarL/FixJ family response regulator